MSDSLKLNPFSPGLILKGSGSSVPSEYFVDIIPTAAKEEKLPAVIMQAPDGRDRAQTEPLFDLDDHRLSVPTIQRPRTGSTARPRRGTLASIEDAGGRGNMDISPADRAFLMGGTVSRDFEQAVEDDNASITSFQHTPGHSFSRGTVRKDRRGSEKSKSRGTSPSPPTSLHAFADHRRRERANTLEVPDATRPVSVEGEHRRRLTFSEGREAKTDDSASSTSTDSEAERDVTFPQDDHPEEGPEIDFEELEEYVADATAPTSPVVVAQEPEDQAKPIDLPASAAVESDDAFDELEKVQRPDSVAERRASQVEVARPFYTFFSPQSEQIIHSTSLGGLLAEGETFRQFFTDSDDACWWLDVVRPSEDVVTVLCKAFSVHPLTREDITQKESREKVEMFNHYYFIAFRSFEDDKKQDDYLDPIPFYAVVFRYGILTFSYKSTPHSSHIFERIRKLRDHMQITTNWLAYALIDDIVDGFMPVINEVDREVDAIEDHVYVAREEDARGVLVKIGESRKKVMSLLRLLGGKSDVIKGFAKRCTPQYEVAPTSDVGMYLSDIQDHVITMRDALTHSEQLLSRIHSNFLAQVNIDNINAGNKTNRMLGKVTLLATILVPMNLITGLFGMNVEVPMRGVNNVGPWFGILGFIVLFSICCMLVFKRMRLI
jgi:magnesium transporter